MGSGPVLFLDANVRTDALTYIRTNKLNIRRTVFLIVLDVLQWSSVGYQSHQWMGQSISTAPCLAPLRRTTAVWATVVMAIRLHGVWQVGGGLELLRTVPVSNLSVYNAGMLFSACCS